MTSAATIDALGNKQSMAVQELVRPDHAPIPAAQTLLNLGCGRKYRDGAVNLDIPSSDVRADVWHDLNLRPWPFEENTFTEVVANDVIEHLRDIIPSMEEIHRICRPGAVVRMTLPHFSCANSFTDPTHQHHFSLFSFDHVTEESGFYSTKRFRILHRHIVFKPTLINKLIWRLAKRNPAEYERRWAWMFPAWYLYFELEVVK